MDKSILSLEVQTFIDANSNADVTLLALQKNKFSAANWTKILVQIASKQKAKTKLPTWFNTLNIYYHSKIALEQSSSEETAQYKSELVSGESLIDLTGGFGVDDFYFSKKVTHINHCEINAELSEIVNHNFKQLTTENIECHVGDSFQILKDLDRKFDWIYIDPSRRNDANGKVFMLKDCLPNVPELLDFYFGFANNILIKTAPILDISAGLSELQSVKAIHIVAVENEVKELLWIVEKNYTGSIEIISCNLAKEKSEKFIFTLGSQAISNFSLPLKFLFEPNAPIMKSGGFNEITAQFAVNKLHQHSHLYTTNDLIDFPGRIFEIESTFDYNKQNVKNLLENKKANITTRNFPETVDSLRKKWKIKDGGNTYCFFTTDLNDNKIVLLCSKLK